MARRLPPNRLTIDERRLLIFDLLKIHPPSAVLVLLTKIEMRSPDSKIAPSAISPATISPIQNPKSTILNRQSIPPRCPRWCEVDDGTTVTHYLYDGWNRIAEFTGQSLDKVYLWGMDLSGTMQGAGLSAIARAKADGVGRLLSVSLITNNLITDNFFPTYDTSGTKAR